MDFFSTPIINGYITFFAWNVLAGTLFGNGSTRDKETQQIIETAVGPTVLGLQDE
jgi:hypothetical protein